MLLVFEDKQKRIINGQERTNFSSFSSFHLVVITARARGRKQVSKIATDDEDLTVRISGRSFPKLSDPKRLADSPAAFSGGALHGLAKTVYFFTFLKGRKHAIELVTDKPQNTATLEGLRVYTLNLEQELLIKTEEQAEDGDRRPWITLVLDNLFLAFVSPKITYSRRKRDSDDVKIIIDSRTQGNLLRNIKHYLWRYVGSLLPSFSTKTETETFTINLPQALHYLEFWADRMPILHFLTLNFGIVPPTPEGIPTVDDPAWTKDFYDDTEEMLLARAIYGEAGGESYEAKIAVGWAIRNRIEDPKQRWGKSYHDVILQPFQYEPFNDPNKDVFKKITNPPISNPAEKKAWQDSFQAAEAVLSGGVPDPTRSANHFHAKTPYEWPSWATIDRFTVEIGNNRFYKL